MKEMNLINYFDMDSICSMIRILPRTQGHNKNISFYLHDKEYKISKQDNSIILTCSDGRELVINVGGAKMRNQLVNTNYVNINCHYTINDSRLAFSKLLPNTVFKDLEELESFRLSNGVVGAFGTNYNGYANTFVRFTENGIDEFIFTNEGIKYNDVLIERDCERIISIDGKDVLSKLEIEDFNIEKEKELYTSLVNDSELKPFTKEMLISKFNEKELTDYKNNLISLYHKLPCLKKAIEFRNIIMNGQINNLVFTKEEMAIFADVLLNVYRDILGKTDEEIIMEGLVNVAENIADEAGKVIKKIGSFFE